MNHEVHHQRLVKAVSFMEVVNLEWQRVESPRITISTCRKGRALRAHKDLKIPPSDLLHNMQTNDLHSEPFDAYRGVGLRATLYLLFSRGFFLFHRRLVPTRFMCLFIFSSLLGNNLGDITSASSFPFHLFSISRRPSHQTLSSQRRTSPLTYKLWWITRPCRRGPLWARTSGEVTSSRRQLSRPCSSWPTGA